MKLSERLLKIFSDNNYQWSRNGDLTIPSEKDLQEGLDRIKSEVVGLDADQQLEVGRLLVKNNDGYWDVYVHVGELFSE